MTPTETFLMQEHQRLLAENRVLRQWILQLASRGDDAVAAQMDAEMDKQIAVQLGKLVENLEARGLPGLAAALDDRTVEEVLIHHESTAKQ